MNPDLEHLVVLQAQDLELARLRAELADTPRQVSAGENALKAAEATLARCKQRVADEEKLRRRQESDIATHRSKLERLRRSLNAATNAQQVTAFEHEIAFAEGSIRTLEDEEFASLERTETAETEQATADREVVRAREALAGVRDRAAALKQRNEAAIAGIERERNSLRAEIAPRWLASYDRLAKVRGTAVAEAVGTANVGKCSACQMSVRPQRWQDLTGRDHEDEIFNCETCGRLLFWDPRRDTPRSWAAGERLGAAGQASDPATGAAGQPSRGEGMR